MSKLALQSEQMYTLTRAHRGVCTPMRRHVRMPSSMAMKSVEALRVSLPKLLCKPHYTANFFMVNSIDFFYVIFLTIVPL